MIGPFPLASIPVLQECGLVYGYDPSLLDYGLVVRRGGLDKIGHFSVAFPLNTPL